MTALAWHSCTDVFLHTHNSQSKQVLTLCCVQLVTLSIASNLLFMDSLCKQQLFVASIRLWAWFRWQQDCKQPHRHLAWTCFMRAFHDEVLAKTAYGFTQHFLPQV